MALGIPKSTFTKEEAKWGLIFISPWVIGFLIFYLIPMIASFGFSLYDFNLANPDQAKFIGFDNWKRFFSKIPKPCQPSLKRLNLG